MIGELPGWTQAGTFVAAIAQVDDPATGRFSRRGAGTGLERRGGRLANPGREPPAESPRSIKRLLIARATVDDATAEHFIRALAAALPTALDSVSCQAP